MQGDDPAYLPVGTAVSAKYKGAFCEAKVSKVVRVVKCKITYKMGLGTATVTDEHIRGPLRVGHTVQARHSERKEFIEATITKIQDCSQYTVVFDDGDITTLRRTALCLKSGRHFNESETLDQLPLTHPEHFGNPVVGGRRGRRSRQLKEDSSEGEVEDETEPDLDLYSGDIGKVVCVEASDKKKSRDNWFPGLVVVPSAQPTVRINVREEYLVRSFKDGRYYTVPKKEILEFSREMGARIENTALAEAMEKAIKYLDNDELPAHWERGPLFDLQLPESESDENYSDSSDDEPREEKDHFVAQLYKFMDDRGTPLNKNPMISNRDIDLYRLFRLVHKIGGYNRVTNQNKWRSVSIRLGYPHNHATYNSVKQAYKKFLLNFEDFYRKLGCTMINHPRNAKKNRGRSLIRDRDRATPINSSPRPERTEENTEKTEEKKEEVEKSPEPTKSKANKTEPVKTKPEKEVETEKVVKKKELSVEPTDSSNSSSDVIIDVQSDSGQGTSKETPKPKKTDAKSIKERKVKGAVGEKVKALVERFEEQPKKEEVKLEEAKSDEKSQQTRSKSIGPRGKDVSSPDRRESTSKEAANRTPKPVRKLEEDKKRGRKRKDTEEKPSPPETSAESPVSTQPVNIGDKLKVYYGPTHESKVTYEAKVLEIERDGTSFIYLVHYTGWNTRYDEWIKPSRIAENLSLTTKAKRLKQSQGSTPKTSNPAKPAAKRGRGMSVSSRTQEPPRSTTPSSVTSSSSRTKSPATPASKSSRVTRQGEVNRRTRRTSAVSIPSESESEQSESESEVSRTRSASKTEEPTEKSVVKKKNPVKRKDDEDTEKEEDSEKPKRAKRLIKKATDVKISPDSDEDSSSPPKGRDFDLNQIRSELKGFEKAVKTTSTEITENIFEDKSTITESKPIISIEKKVEEKTKTDKIVSTDDIYEFKEPEPFEFETRGPKLNEDKNVKKRLVPRLFDDLEKPDKSPKKKGGKSPPKNDTKEEETKKRPFRRTPVKKTEEEEEKSPPKEDPVKISEDAFDKLVESPSFNIGNNLLDKKLDNPSPDITKSKIVKTLNLDEPLSLFRELPETVGEDSGDRLDLSDTDDTQTEPLFSHKEQIFSDPAFTKSETTSLDPIFRGFNSAVKIETDDVKKRSIKDGASDEDDPIGAAIHRVMTHTMTDEESSNDDLFINQPTTIYQPKLKPKDESPKPIIPIGTPKLLTATVQLEELKEPLIIATDIGNNKEIKSVPKETTNIAKQISPALQETDSSLLEAISIQTQELLKKEEVKEPTIKTGTKIADSILQKFNMIKKKEETKPVKVEIKQEPVVKIEKPIEIRKEIKVEYETPEIKETLIEPSVKIETILNDFPLEIKKRSAKKIVSREFIEESDTDSSDSEQRLVIARSDDDSQTNPLSEKLDFKDTDSNISALQVNTDDSEEQESVFKFEESKPENVPEPVVENPLANVKTEPSESVKQEEDQDNNISLLLCKETIPGSPAPVPEVTATPESRVKPKSAKSLLLEMPFASAPGSSNGKGLLTNPVEHKQQQKPIVKPEPQPLAMPLEPACDANETNNPVINTPPTTPESTISNLSPRGDQDRISLNAADNESCKSTDSGPREQPSKVQHYSEEDTLMNPETCPAPKKPPKEENAAPCRKRRRSCKTSEESAPPKRGRRPLARNVRANSDSDDTSEHSAPGSTPPSAHSNANHNNSISGETRLSSRSPRPSKYNFIIDLDPSMECGQRISLLQQKLSELRKTYNNVKTELACIDRRRKKLRRREREALKAAKQEMACA